MYRDLTLPWKAKQPLCYFYASECCEISAACIGFGHNWPYCVFQLCTVSHHIVYSSCVLSYNELNLLCKKPLPTAVEDSKWHGHVLVLLGNRSGWCTWEHDFAWIKWATGKNRVEVYSRRSWRVNQIELRKNFRDRNLLPSSQGRERTQSEEAHGVS